MIGQPTNLGPGSLGSSVSTGRVLGGNAYVVTRGLTPAVLGIYDLNARRVTTNATIPTGGGAWSSTVAGGNLYIGMYYVADLYRYDTAAQQLTKVASFPNDSYICALSTSPDGKIFAGTYPTGSVYEYDPVTGQVTDAGVAEPGQSYVRSVAVDDSTIYAGVGAEAHLIAINRATGARTDILPPPLRGEAFVYEIEITPDYLIGGTYPSATLFVINKRDDADYRIVRPDCQDCAIDAIAVAGDRVYFSAGPYSTHIYEYNLATSRLSTLAAAAPGSNHGLCVDDNSLIGFADCGVIWNYDMSNNTMQVAHLAEAGLRSAPELPQSLLTTDDAAAYVGGHNGMEVHNLTAGTRHHLPVDGEPKAMALADGQVYLAVYPTGAIHAYKPRTGGVRQLAVIGQEQIRPRDMHYDPVTKQLLIGTAPDYGKLGGALTLYSPSSGAMQVLRNIVPQQSIGSIAAHGEIGYLGSEIAGGGGVRPTAAQAELAAVDLRSHQVVWTLIPVPAATAIRHLALFGGLIYGTTDTGTLFVVDPTTRRVLATAQVAIDDEVAIAAHRDAVYGASHQQLFRIDPHTYTANAIASGLAADPDAYPWLNSGGCYLYTFSHDDLLRVRVGSRS